MALMTLNDMDLSFVFDKQTDFPKIKYKNVKYFNLVHVHKPKFALPSAQQEYPVTFKLMTSQVVQRARPLNRRLWVHGRKRVQRYQ